MPRRKSVVVALLLFAVGIPLLPGQEAGNRAFFEVIGRGDTTEVTRQLDAGVSPDATDSRGTNALYLACEKKRPSVALLLLNRGADPNLTPPHGSTALQLAIYKGFDSYVLKPKTGYPELIQALVKGGANVNAADVEGNTPLIAAAEKDDVATLRLLLEHGVLLGHKNGNGWTALERAVQYRRRTIARQLVAAGAPLDEVQQEHLRRYQFARKAGHWFPVILVGSFLLAGLMHRRFKALPQRTESPLKGDDLPKLLPLKCNACGGSATIKPGKAACSHCHEPVPVPEDYQETLKLRARTFKMMRKALRLWKHVRQVSVAPVRWALWLAAGWFVWQMWPGLFPHFVRDAFYDLMTFSGTMTWALGVLTMAAVAIALVGYALYLAAVRLTLPAMPDTGKSAGEAEDIPCVNCGGMVEIKAGDLVGICGYCGSETYRVALARQARAAASSEQHKVTVSLYDAMRQVYEMRENAALAIPMAIIVIGVGLVAVLYVVLLFV